jgi:hypothetical protein
MHPADKAPDSNESLETESDLISRAQVAVSQCNWVVGECAARWTQRYAKGRTDADFGQLVGLSGDQVYQRRRVWETFGDVRGDYPSLKWSHFYISLNWDDAPECLQWAEENQATVSELKMWRRAMHGTDAVDDSPPDPWGGDPSISFLPTTPVAVRDVDESTGDPAERSRPDSEGERADKSRIETAYAPFRSNAGSAPETTNTEGASGNIDAEQLLKRMTTALERINKALTPEFLESVEDIPEAVLERFQSAVEELQAKASQLIS